MAYHFDHLSLFMDEAIARLGVSGIDCIIYQDHQEIFRHMSGYRDLEQKLPMAPGMFYNIYSATKVIVCTAAMQLLERGKLVLSDPVSKYLPEFESMKVKTGTFTQAPAQKPILISDLFSMTAGISYEPDTPEKRKLLEETGGDFSTRDFVRAIAREPLLFDPGEGWNYGYCHDVLGAVIEVITGLSLGTYLEQNIFAPLGMKEAGFSLAEEHKHRLAPQYAYDTETGATVRISSDRQGPAGRCFESGGGGLIMTPEDYMLFADALACGGVGKTGARILSCRAIDLMRQNRLRGKQLEDFHRMGISEGVGYGLGVGTIMNPVAAGTLAPQGAFYWGGIGGVQNLFDSENRLSFFVAQHTYRSPKDLLVPNIRNIIYAAIS